MTVPMYIHPSDAFIAALGIKMSLSSPSLTSKCIICLSCEYLNKPSLVVIHSASLSSIIPNALVFCDSSTRSNLSVVESYLSSPSSVAAHIMPLSSMHKLFTTEWVLHPLNWRHLPVAGFSRNIPLLCDASHICPLLSSSMSIMVDSAFLTRLKSSVSRRYMLMPSVVANHIFVLLSRNMA